MGEGMTLRDVGRSIVAFLRRHIRRPRVEISLGSVISVVALLITVGIAYLIRLMPAIGFDVLVREFDCWYQYQNTVYVLQHGFAAWFSWIDMGVWVPFGRNVPVSTYPGVPFTCALMYMSLSAIGIHVDLMWLCVIFPPIFGALGVAATYFLGKEVANKEVGLFAAFFMAIIPAYTQRTIAGFFDTETTGIFAAILTLYFFCRSLRKGSIGSAVLAGLAMAYLCLSWSVYMYVFELLAIFALVMVLLRRYSRRLLAAYSGTVMGGLMLAIIIPRTGPDFLYSETGIIPLGIFGLLLLIEVSRAFRLTERRAPLALTRSIARLRPYVSYIFGGMCALVVVGLGYLFQSGLVVQLLTAQPSGFLAGIGGKFATVIDPLIRRSGAMLLASVGEHLPAPWATFWYNLGFLVLVVPFGFYAAFRREAETDLLLIVFTLTAVYFCGSMIRLALLLAPAAAIVGSYGLIVAITPFRTVFWQRPVLTRRRRRITPPTTRGFATITYLAVMILLLGTTVISLSYVNQMGPAEIIPGGRNMVTGDGTAYTDYLETFSWMRAHTPPGSVIVAWWDYGYWIRVAGNRSSVDDNGTINKTQIAWVGRMMMERNPLEALRIARRWNATYVLAHFGLNEAFFSGDENKWQWMIRIAGEVFGSEVPTEYLFWDGAGNIYSPLYDTLLYNLLWVNASAELYNIGVTSMPTGYQEPVVTTDPAKTIFSMFQPVYTSALGLMKLYEINYTRLDSMMELGGASAYALHNGTGTDDSLSSLTLEVKNTGLYPFIIDSVSVTSPQFTSPTTVTADDMSTTSGSLRVEAGQSVVVNARIPLYYRIGSQLTATVTAANLSPALNATISVPVRAAPDYNISAVLPQCYAYANGTVHVQLSNTGEGYCAIDSLGYINNNSISLVDKSDRGRVLFTGDSIVFNLDAADTMPTGLTLTAGDTIELRFHYMSRLELYYGQNVTFTLTVQATPSPPTPSQEAEASSSAIPVETTSIRQMPLVSQSGLLSPVACSCPASSAFFICRRYFP
jgi:dolichyl-diphosphooligosaccharide--protein glycosyltransferase